MVPLFLLYPAYYRSIRYELREDEIVVHKGIITKSTKVVPYSTVTNLNMKRDLLDRWLLNLGTVNVETAGKSGQAEPERGRVMALRPGERLDHERHESTRKTREALAHPARCPHEAPPPLPGSHSLSQPLSCLSCPFASFVVQASPPTG